MLKVVHDLTPIFVKTSDVPLTKTRQQFIRAFLVNKAMVTYHNLSCTQTECYAGKNRSITDIHRITLSRFPKTSFDAIVRIIKDLIDHDALFRMTYCTQINKVVLMYVSESRREYSSPYADKNYIDTKGVDGYTLRDFKTEIENLKTN